MKNMPLRINYKELGLDPDTLNAARIGSGPESVVIYCDPVGSLTHELMQKALNFPNADNYSFFFVVTIN